MSKRKKSQIAPTRGDLKKNLNSGKPNMTSKVFEISRGNLNDAIELFLRQNSIIDDDQTVVNIEFQGAINVPRSSVVKLNINLKQEATVITYNGT
jgi:hypothetical protein